jgi:hypothetical protein
LCDGPLWPQAARAYQEAADRALQSALRSLDPGKIVVSGSPMVDPLPPSRQRALAWLRHAEGQLKERFGDTGVALVRAVLIECQGIEVVGRAFGATSSSGVRGVRWIFRQCLDALAVTFNLARSTRQPYRPVFVDGHDPAEDPGRQAREHELGDPRLRSGRANG